MKRSLLLSTLVITGLSANALADISSYEMSYAFAQPENFSVNQLTAATENSIEAIFTEDFSSLGNNSIPAGWIVYDGDNTHIGPKTGASGNRVFALTGNPRAWDYAVYFCLRSGTENAYMSYGEQEGNRLTLSSGTYKLSYSWAKWQKDGNDPVKAQILDLSKSTIVSEEKTCTGPIIADASSPIQDVATETVNFEITTDGDYVLKLEHTGGPWSTALLIANIKIEKITGDPNLVLFETAMTNAKNTLNTICDENGDIIEKYAGDIATILQNIVESYTAAPPTNYAAAATEVETATTNAATHKTNVDKFCTARDTAAAALSANAGTKYESLDCYPNLQAAYNEYQNTPYTDDATLITANEILSKQTAVLTNMASFGVSLLTERLNRLVELATKLGIDETNEYVVKAKAALNDDDELANELSKLCEKKLYRGIAAGTDYFADGDSLNMSGFMKNPEMYVLTEKTTGKNIAKGNLSEACPGWDDTGTSGWGDWTVNIADNSQGGSDLAETKNCPVANSMLTTWSGEIIVQQELTGIPAGKYTLCTRSYNQNAGDTKVSNQILYITINGETTSIPWAEVGGWFGGAAKPSYTTFLKDIEITDPNSTVIIGISYTSTGTNTFVKSFGLYMTGKSETFNYDEASQPMPLELESSSLIDGSHVANLSRVAFFLNNGAKPVGKAVLYKEQEAVATSSIKTDIAVAGSNLVYVDFADATKGFAPYATEQDAQYVLALPQGVLVGKTEDVLDNDSIGISFIGGTDTVIIQDSVNVSYTLGDNTTTQIKVTKGSEMSYTFAPATGWKVSTLTLNGEDVLENLGENMVYKTPALAADAIINVNLEYTGFTYTENVNGVVEIEGSTLRVNSQNGKIHINGLTVGDAVTIYSMGGSVLGQFSATMDEAIVNVPANTTYLVRINDKVAKVLNK